MLLNQAFSIKEAPRALFWIGIFLISFSGMFYLGLNPDLIDKWYLVLAGFNVLMSLIAIYYIVLSMRKLKLNTEQEIIGSKFTWSFIKIVPVLVLLPVLSFYLFSFGSIRDNLQIAEIQFEELGINKKVLEKKIGKVKVLTKKNIITSILEMVFADFNSKFCIVKHPPYGYLGELQEMFPNIKLIHIIRDGRAVYSSKRDTSSLSGKSMSNNVLMSALDWRYKLIQIQRFSGKKINVLFENLVANTNYELDRVLDFLELSDNDRLLSGDQEDYFQNIGPKQKTIHANVQSKPKSEITTKWKKNLTPKIGNA